MSNNLKSIAQEHTNLQPIGRQIRINHADCPAGRDTKRRLYIKRKDNGKLYLYCQHCSTGLVYHLRYGRYRQKVAEDSQNNRQELRDNPATNANDRASVYQEWAGRLTRGTLGSCSAAAREWIGRVKLSSEHMERRGLIYDTVDNRLSIPIVEGDAMVGHQWRHFDRKPKYLTVYFDEDKPLHWLNQHQSKHLFVCEDILSSWVINQRYDVVALLTTQVKSAKIHHIASRYNSFVVWLDSDNAHVKKAESKLSRQLEKYGNVNIIRTGDDPKYYTIGDITCLLENANRRAAYD